MNDKEKQEQDKEEPQEETPPALGVSVEEKIESNDEVK